MTTRTDLSSEESYPDASPFRFGMVTALWHRDITSRLENSARQTLLNHGAAAENIVAIHVPGSFELIAGARLLMNNEKLNAIICLGCLIKGETPHFDFLSQSIAHALAMLSARYSFPFIFGVITTLNIKQALERAGGRHGNKGEEAALAAIRMASLFQSFKKNTGIGFR
jgi:6,7-dimethyl-8-ribityllumazine synthase